MLLPVSAKESPKMRTAGNLGRGVAAVQPEMAVREVENSTTRRMKEDAMNNIIKVAVSEECRVVISTAMGECEYLYACMVTCMSRIRYVA